MSAGHAGAPPQALSQRQWLPQVKALEPQAGGAEGQAGSGEAGSTKAGADEVSIFGSRPSDGDGEGQDGQQKGGQ
jgi:hypothetical protein